MSRSVLNGGVKTLPYYAILSPIYVMSLALFGCYLVLKQHVPDAAALSRPFQRFLYNDLTAGLLVILIAWWTIRLASRCRRRSIIYGKHSIYFADFGQRLRYDQFFANPQTLVPMGLDFVTVNPGILPRHRSRRKVFFSVCYLRPFSVLRRIQLEGLKYARSK